MSESSGSESVADKRKLASRKSDSPAISMGSNSGKILPHVASPGKQSDSHRFVGTVDVSCLAVCVRRFADIVLLVCRAGEYIRGRRWRGR